MEKIATPRPKKIYSKQSDQRLHMILTELNMVEKEIENKQIEAQYKANILRIVNTLSSLIIIIGAAVIAGMEAVSSCINIPVLVFSAIIFFTEATHKLFQWGPQGVLYMHGSIQLKKLYRQTRDYELFYDKYSAEQLLTFVSMLRSQCDDVDMGLYKLSVNGQAHAGFDVNSNPLPNSSLPGSPLQETSHVHIHIDSERNNSSRERNNQNTPVLIVPDDSLLTPSRPIKQSSNVKISTTPSTPQRTPQSKTSTPKLGMPTITIDSDDSHDTVIDIPNN